MPQPLKELTRTLGKKYPMSSISDEIAGFTNYLLKRKLPVEDTALQVSAMKIEEEVRKQFVSEGCLEENSPSVREQEKRIQNIVLKNLRNITYCWRPLNYQDALCRLYMAGRMDGIFAATMRVFGEIERRIPDFAPHSVMDFGSGTGSSIWAAWQTWGENLHNYHAVDLSASMNSLAKLLIKGGEEIKRPLIRGVHFHTVLPPKVHCDVVVATYTLSELPGMKERVEAVCSLWKKTKCFLVLIENGTRSGHDVILEARDTLIKESRNGITENCDGYVFAPCPHEQQCPLPQQTKPLPCSFVQKYHPFPFPWNEPIKVEKFSFLIFSRGQKAVDQDWPRIVQPVLCRARHVHCHLCCADGTFQHAIITRKKHGRDVYRTTRACTWGDRLPVKLLPQEDNAVEEE
uniref:ribosome assembly protein METTL17, mitochondrial-like isoform X1 n=2 Tax=Myxine glutinosa TaxID=7769 RepID=UPI00358F2635